MKDTDRAAQQCHGGGCKGEIPLDAGRKAAPWREQLARAGWTFVNGKCYCAHCSARMAGQEELAL